MITSLLLLSCDCTRHKTQLVIEEKQQRSPIFRSGRVSELHLEMVEVFPDDFISPGHLPQEARKHGIGEFLLGNTRQHGKLSSRREALIILQSEIKQH